ncbi:two-component system sensor protein [Oceanobacter sp. RED65]|uniref:Two-component system sensor protein n=2 Tax=Bermanella marisrubri TaxID=207949 RepID=Q1N4K1_9GAMM|nr:two-component system sensor protein [Oceanobacter sp. RED65] [Bermanella marisrubri]
MHASPMTIQRHQFLRVADPILATLTSITVAVVTMYLWVLDEQVSALVSVSQLSIAMITFVFVVNVIANYCSSHPQYFDQETPPAWFWMSAISAVIVSLIFPSGLTQVLWILTIAKASRYFHWRLCVGLAVSIPIALSLFHYIMAVNPYLWINAVLYSLFNLFALYISFTLISEKKAHGRAAELVNELTAMQALLAASSRRDERIQIARDLHDLSGHHLSALSLQLEIAKHTQGKDHEEAISQAGVIAHLLMSELREVVSVFRGHSSIQLEPALKAIIDNLPKLDVWLDWSPSIRIESNEEAEVLLRTCQEALTNIVKHTKATRAAILLKQKFNQIELRVLDNGGLKSLPQFGNGLQGMQERVEKIGGKLSLSIGDNGLEITVLLARQHAAVA